MAKQVVYEWTDTNEDTSTFRVTSLLQFNNELYARGVTSYGSKSSIIPMAILLGLRPPYRGSWAYKEMV